MGGQAKAPVLTVAILITGNLVGAGILGLPINTGLAGYVPSLIVMVLVWGLMLGSAVVISDQVLASGEENFDLPSLFGRTLGPAGQWLAVLANLLILYGLLVAYLSGGTSILVNLFNLTGPAWVVTLLFFAFSTIMTLFGVVIVRKGNAVLMVVMWLAFLGLVALALPEMKPGRLVFTDLVFIPSALPIMLCAFHFHNIIPTACHSLDLDRKAILKALLVGTLIGLGMNALWNLTVMGALPVSDSSQSNILCAFQGGVPATVPLAAIVGSKLFTTFGLAFAILAITTSYLANGTALLSFCRDMSQSLLGTRNAVLVAALAFGPPLAVTLFYPNLFLRALDMVGGVGISLLFGILPGVLLIRQARSHRARALGLVMVVCFAGILVFELGQEFGLLRIDPDLELWKAGLRMFPGK
ncbi:MAG: tryptophan/tyrosine permease [Proteobacteria bacterium]|nr:tryptophan/tyrosine permease [Pseudomonadota bacterium]